MAREEDTPEGPLEIPIVGELTEHETDICDKLLSVPVGGECILYFNSPGGSAYAALSLMSLLVIRDLQATGIVTGECSSAALWPLAACKRRYVTPHSILLFHPMKWQSEEHIGLSEAAEWSRHFSQLEKEMDQMLADLFEISLDKMNAWINPGRYVFGRELAEAGLAELVDIHALPKFQENGAPRRRQKAKAKR